MSLLSSPINYPFDSSSPLVLGKRKRNFEFGLPLPLKRKALNAEDEDLGKEESALDDSDTSLLKDHLQKRIYQDSTISYAPDACLHTRVLC